MDDRDHVVSSHLQNVFWITASVPFPREPNRHYQRLVFLDYDCWLTGFFASNVFNEERAWTKKGAQFTSMIFAQIGM